MSRGHENWRERQTPAQGRSQAPRAQQSGGRRSPQHRPAHTGTHSQGTGRARLNDDWRNRPEQVPAAPSEARESSSPGSSLSSPATPSPVALPNASGSSSLENSLSSLDTPSPSGVQSSATERAVVPQHPIKHPIVEVARIYNLPSLKWNSPARQASTELRRQPHVNERAGEHPTLVWDLYEREGDKVQVARCLQVTSFMVNGQHRTIEEKYNRGGDAWKFQCQYLPIQHHGWTTSATNQPILALLYGRDMLYQSYVHLDHFFEIEAHLLQPFGNKPLVLDWDSLNAVLTKLRHFIKGWIWRPTYTEGGRVPRSPLDVRFGQCGGPMNLSEHVSIREEFGSDAEDKRTLWGHSPAATGFETERPY